MLEAPPTPRVDITGASCPRSCRFPWIATVLVMDGSLKHFKAEKEQVEAEKKGRNTWPGTCRFGQIDHKTQAPTRPADDARQHARGNRSPIVNRCLEENDGTGFEPGSPC